MKKGGGMIPVRYGRSGYFVCRPMFGDMFTVCTSTSTFLLVSSDSTFINISWSHWFVSLDLTITFIRQRKMSNELEYKTCFC